MINLTYSIISSKGQVSGTLMAWLLTSAKRSFGRIGLPSVLVGSVPTIDEMSASGWCAFNKANAFRAPSRAADSCHFNICCRSARRAKGRQMSPASYLGQLHQLNRLHQAIRRPHEEIIVEVVGPHGVCRLRCRAVQLLEMQGRLPCLLFQIWEKAKVKITKQRSPVEAKN